MLGFATTLRTAIANAIIAAIDAGATAATLRIYSGARPATGAAITDQVLLSEHPLSDPCGSAANGIISFDPITEDAAANADGTATWARIVDGDGTFVMDLSVGEIGSGADIELNTTVFLTGGPVSVTATRTITIGNA